MSQTKDVIDENQILQSNKRVDSEVVKQYKDLEAQLEKLGVNIKPKYRLSPPLGSTKPLLYNK